MEFTSGSDIYKFYFSNTSSNVCNQSSSNKTYLSDSGKLSGGNVIRNSNRCLFFSFTNGDAVSSPANSYVIITGPPSADSNGNDCKRLQVYTNGRISIISGSSCT